MLFLHISFQWRSIVALLLPPKTDSGGTASAGFLEAAHWKWICIFNQQNSCTINWLPAPWASAHCGFPSPLCSPHRCNDWLLQIVSQKGWNPRLYSAWIQNSQWLQIWILCRQHFKERSRESQKQMPHSGSHLFGSIQTILLCFTCVAVSQSSSNTACSRLLDTLPFPLCIRAQSGVTMTFSWHADEGFSWAGNAASL